MSEPVVLWRGYNQSVTITLTNTVVSGVRLHLSTPSGRVVISGTPNTAGDVLTVTRVDGTGAESPTGANTKVVATISKATSARIGSGRTNACEIERHPEGEFLGRFVIDGEAGDRDA